MPVQPTNPINQFLFTQYIFNRLNKIKLYILYGYRPHSLPRVIPIPVIKPFVDLVKLWMGILLGYRVWLIYLLCMNKKVFVFT